MYISPIALAKHERSSYNAFMELKELTQFFKLFGVKILSSGITAGLLGVILYYVLPVRFIATGSFYIHRAVEGTTNRQYFTYEGYYGQQTAQAYTNTVIAILESTDMQKKALEKMDLTVNEQNLRKVSKQIKVVKEAPQLVSVTVKGNTPKNASELFTNISGITIETAKDLNSRGDPALLISPVDEPVVKEIFRNVFINFFAGLVLGVTVSIPGFAFYKYFKELK